VQFWDAADPMCKQILQGRLSDAISIFRSPDANYLASVARTMSVRVWDGSICEAEQTSPVLGVSVSFFSTSPDGTVLLSVAGVTMQLWTTDGVCTHTLTHPAKRVQFVSFSPEGKTFASVAEDDAVCMWDVETGSLLHTLKYYGEWIGTVVFSPDGTTLAGGSVDTLQLWDLVTGSSKNSFEGFSIHDAYFFPDGKFLAAFSSRGIFLLNIATDVQQTLDSPHQDDIIQAAFSPDSKILASSSVDGTFCLWDTATGTCTHTFKLKGEGMYELSFSDDGKFLLTDLGRSSLDNGSVSPQQPASEEGLASPSVSSDKPPSVKAAYAWPLIDGLRYDGEWVTREGRIFSISLRVNGLHIHGTPGRCSRILFSLVMHLGK
jgi:WD40 repeat protein